MTFGSTSAHQGPPATSRVRVGGWGRPLLWTVLLAVLLYVALVANEEQIGAAGGFLHEFFHDGRHMLGVPCH